MTEPTFRLLASTQLGQQGWQRSPGRDDIIWGYTQAHREDWEMVKAALDMGASTVRIGFEDSDCIAPPPAVQVHPHQHILGEGGLIRPVHGGPHGVGAHPDAVETCHLAEAMSYRCTVEEAVKLSGCVGCQGCGGCTGNSQCESRGPCRPVPAGRWLRSPGN